MEENRQFGHLTQAGYHAYLLRLWREGPHSPWRAMLQDVATGQRQGFAGLAALWMYLRAQTGGGAPGSDERARTPEFDQWEP